MIFQPTYLYVKQHSVTNLKYLGKTIKKNPEKYLGSGKYWSPHRKKHGNQHVETPWYCLFTEEAELVKFALMISAQWDIVNSDEWANLIPENGLDGGGNGGALKGRKLSIEHKKKLSIVGLGRKNSSEHIEKTRQGHLGSKRSNKTKENIRLALKGRKCSPIAVEKSAAGHRGLKRSIEAIEKTAAANRGRKHSPEAKVKIVAAVAKSRLKVVCTHCKIEGGANLMKRWHFDNCKNRGTK